MIRHVVALSFLASLFLALPVIAADEVSEIDICRDFSLVAKDVMTARQKKRPMSATLPIARARIKAWADKYGREVDMEEAEDWAADIVIRAYRGSAYDIPELQRDRIADFENSYFEECYTQLTSDSEE